MGQNVVVVARQPIFNKAKKTVAYELLYRSMSSKKNEFPTDQDGTFATLQVIQNTLLSIGVEKIIAGKKAFVNFTKKTILEKIPLSLNPRSFVIEILEDIKAEPEIIQALKILRHRGFTIALDDFICRDDNKELIEHANIIKVDVLNTPEDEFLDLTSRLKGYKKVLLAEKIENEEVFNKCLSLGYDLFQGFFFSKPEIIEGRDLPANKMNLIKLLSLISNEDIDIRRISRVIETDPSLSYKLLKIVNSAAFARTSESNEIKSIQQAIIILGEKEVRRWITIISLSSLSEDKPQELVVTSCIRAKFCELVAEKVMPEIKESAFLCGLFSLFDVMMGKSMEEILENIPISNEVKTALIDKKGFLYELLKLVEVYEKMELVNISQITDELNLEREELFNIYVKSTEWANNVYAI